MDMKNILEKFTTDESKQNKIMISIIVVCFALAGIITCVHFSGNNVSLEDSDYEKIWVKCKNPDCRSQYQMDMDEYFMMTEENLGPEQETHTPALRICEKCGKKSISKAVKCNECSLIFFYETSSDLPDKCPKCGYSSTEQFQNMRKQKDK